MLSAHKKIQPPLFSIGQKNVIHSNVIVGVIDEREEI
jgi:hypothetical protein